MNRDLKEVYIKQMLLPKEELALQTMELMADKMILEDNWNKLKEWLEEYIETNEKWYSSELSNHDKEYYKKDYIDSNFWLMKFQNQMQEIEGGINE